MINEKLDLIRKWLDGRSPREQLTFYVITVLLTYVIWSWLIDGLLISKNNTLTKKMSILHEEINGIKTELTTLLNIVNKDTYSSAIKKRQKLSGQYYDVKQRVDRLLPNLTTTKNLPKILADLFEQKSGIKLISLKKLPPTLWAPFGLTQKELPDNMHNITQYSFEIEVQGTYFNIMNYLNYLEKLPWRLYWEKIDYKVTKHPEANVVVTLFILVH